MDVIGLPMHAPSDFRADGAVSFATVAFAAAAFAVPKVTVALLHRTAPVCRRSLLLSCVLQVFTMLHCPPEIFPELHPSQTHPEQELQVMAFRVLGCSRTPAQTPPFPSAVGTGRQSAFRTCKPHLSSVTYYMLCYID